MEADQRRERLLHHPGEARAGQPAPRLGERRHVMDHVAERGGLDEQDVGHAAPVTLRHDYTPRPRLSPAANACIHDR